MLIRHIRGRCGKKEGKKERNLTLFTLYTEFTLSNWLCLLCLDNHVQSETALCSSLSTIPALPAYLLRVHLHSDEVSAQDWLFVDEAKMQDQITSVAALLLDPDD